MRVRATNDMSATCGPAPGRGGLRKLISWERPAGQRLQNNMRRDSILEAAGQAMRRQGFRVTVLLAIASGASCEFGVSRRSPPVRDTREAMSSASAALVGVLNDAGIADGVVTFSRFDMSPIPDGASIAISRWIPSPQWLCLRWSNGEP